MHASKVADQFLSPLIEPVERSREVEFGIRIASDFEIDHRQTARLARQQSLEMFVS
jgi:hypothetical protein